MWCRFGTAIAAVSLSVTASIVMSDTVLAKRSRDYRPEEFRSVLRGLGYNVTVSSGPLTDQTTRAAIREFQRGYRLPIDGLAGARTQDLAADIVRILQANLNLVSKPSPLLPRNQFYGPRTTTAVTLFQRQFSLTRTGIATLAVRQRLDAEAREILGKEALPSSSSDSDSDADTQQAPQRIPQRTPAQSPEPSPEETPEPETPEPETPEASPSPSP